MKIYITLTNHCIDQIKDRNPDYPTSKEACKFWEYMFEKFILTWEHEWRKVRYSYTKDGKYKITDGLHQFIFAKPYKIEYTLITYVKRQFGLWEKLRPKEKYIKPKLK